MLFNSYVFILFFLPFTLISFFLAAKLNRSLALAVLLLASLLFYGWNDYHFVFLLVFSILTNFLISQTMIHTQLVRPRKIIFTAGIFFNLALLSYFKYADFFIENANTLLAHPLNLLHIALPIGISFFTFTQIAFLVDCYRGLVPPYRLLNYALFVTYFPHLIAGPIIHHKEVMPQFAKNRTFVFNARNVALGTTLFTIGLCKKSILADSLGQLAIPIFDLHLQHIATLDAWIAALAYTLELYFDFSGYSDMALGLSLLIGVKLPVNFYSPYKAVNIIEFWRRWNMTLSRFLRDYLYIPLGGNRHGTLRRYLNLVLTMLLGGLWHGANWTFVFWGFLHGIFLCVNHGWNFLCTRAGLSFQRHAVFSMFSCLLTFLCVTIAWVFFRAPDFLTASNILHSMFLQHITLPANHHYPSILMPLFNHAHIAIATDSTWVTNYEAIKLIVMALLIVWFLPNSYQLLRRYKPALLSLREQTAATFNLMWKPTLAWTMASALLFIFAFVYTQASSIFLYFRF